MSQDSRLETHQHIAEVRGLLLGSAMELMRRGHIHDQSKLERPEVEIFNEFGPRLKDLTFGSDEYEECRREMGKALEHHYANNSHHPEFGEAEIEWRDVKDFACIYQISNLGDVKCLHRVVKRDGDRGDLTVPEKILKAAETPKGYLRIQLGRNGKSANRMVHRLVAEAFIENPDDKPQVNHLDGNKKNNHFRNLEWATPSENQIHAYDTGLKEPSIKYVVHCVELGITTFGTERMEKELRDRGYDRARSAGIWSAMDRAGQHLDLTFEGSLLADSRRSRIAGMSLFDLIEMICDWMASVNRHADGDIMKSIEKNQARFGYSDEMKQILTNTVVAVLGLPAS